MELEFQKKTQPCLRKIKREVQNSEQTQEIRVSDEMPDVGTVLGAWGQVLLRGKQWRNGEMQATVGVMAWVLYTPENGGEPRCVETWIPMQLRWELPDTERDGQILTCCTLRSVDARSISARKLLVRASVGVLAEAMAPEELAVYSPENLPEDVQLLSARYPMELPAEAGEKPFSLEEPLSLPSQMQKPVYYCLHPRITETKVLSGKVVFRGVADLHILFMGQDGALHSEDVEFPFSQYGELERDYDPDATAQVYCEVTGLELTSQEDGKWMLKAGLTGQYVISHRPVLQVVEDAYSLTREVSLKREEMPVCAILDRSSQTLTAQQTISADVGRIVDVCMLTDHGVAARNDGSVEITVPGTCQLLYEDPQGQLQSITAGWEENWDIPADPKSKVCSYVIQSAAPQAVVGAGNVSVTGTVQMDAVTQSSRGIEMISAMELGQEITPDLDRPSLILCRCGNRSLWEIAKDCKTTTDAICLANGVEETPPANQILLIPIV